jgi:hypothetical protein
MTLEEELAPYREWYDAELTALEYEWAAELSAHVAEVAKVIHPLAVSQAWINYIKTEDYPATAAHFKKRMALWDEFMLRTADIWERHE